MMFTNDDVNKMADTVKSFWVVGFFHECYSYIIFFFIGSLWVFWSVKEGRKEGSKEGWMDGWMEKVFGWSIDL